MERRKEGKVIKLGELSGRERYDYLLSKSSTLMFPGLEQMLESGQSLHCDRCRYRGMGGAKKAVGFSRVELCDSCRKEWHDYLESLVIRAEKVFPELLSVIPAEARERSQV